MKNILSFFPIVERAFEISQVSDTSIILYYDESLYKNGHKDCQLLSNELMLSKTYSGSSIYAKVIKPDINMILGETKGHQTMEGIMRKAIEIRKCKLDNTSLNLSSKSLLKRAYEKFDLNVSQIILIERLAIAIAKLDNNKLIEAQHIVEAINYSILPKDMKIY